MHPGREIKFQIYDQDTKNMWTWEDIVEAYHAGFIDFMEMLMQDQFLKRQFTGLRDKNGREIYEGDIVDYWRGEYRRKWSIVKFGEYEQDGSGGEYSATKCFGFYVETIKLFPTPLDLEFNDEPHEVEEEKTVSILEFDYEVIGNIYENPELLEVGK